MNNDRLGQPTRYSYHPRIAPAPTLLFDGCIAYDTEAGTSVTHSYGPGRVGGETVFAPRPGGTDENDGWVMSFVTDTHEQRSELRVLDARDVAAGPIARVLLPARVPVGFHSHWAPATA